MIVDAGDARFAHLPTIEERISAAIAEVAEDDTPTIFIPAALIQEST